MESEMLKFFNLKDNPFKLEIILETFVGYVNERETLINAIKNKEKLILVIGPTGVGKTTLLLWVFKNLDKKNKIFLYRPPENKEDLQKSLKKNLNMFDKIIYFFKGFERFLKDKEYIFFIDESTFMNDNMLEYIKVLSDQTKAIFILSGLHEFEEKIMKEHRTLYERIQTKIYLKALEPIYGKELIKKRLEYAGNPNLFTEEAIDLIYKISSGFPREILKIAYECLSIAYKQGSKIVDINIVSKLHEEKKALGEKIKLTEKQRYIAEIIIKYGPKTAGEIFELMKNKYEDVTIHSISNILKRMVNIGYLVRTKHQGKYVYDITPKIKNILIREIMK